MMARALPPSDAWPQGQAITPSQGRVLISDPDGPIVLFPCARNPQHFRLATAEEIDAWEQDTARALIELGHELEDEPACEVPPCPASRTVQPFNPLLIEQTQIKHTQIKQTQIQHTQIKQKQTKGVGAPLVCEKGILLNGHPDFT